MPPSVQGLSIVIIEDEELTLSALVDQLSPRNKVQPFSSATNLQAAASFLGKVDLFIIDYLLHDGQNGIDLFREFHPLHPEAKFMLISGNIDRQLAETVLNVGFDALLMKPFDFSILEYNIVEIMAK
ncbi:MAG: response regulator [Candidatus Methylacidiphilales bacterium]|nr:response regulator [Candidatus Methylacidiphilales bacterium]